MDGSAPLEHVTASPEVLSVASLFTPKTLLLSSLSAAVLLLSILFVLARRKVGASGDVVLLVGPPDAGKTAIMSTLVYKKTLPTQMSMQTNAAVITLSPKHKLRLVDIPGHPRIRDQFRDHMPDAKVIAFIVDSSTISRTGPAVAEHLHQILHDLTSLPPSQTPPSLLIVAHKSDLLKATAQATPDQLAINRVRTILERELEKRRASHANDVGIERLGEDDGESEMGGLECNGSSEFRFANWEGGEVDFVGTSVTVGATTHAEEEKSFDDGGLSPLCQWLEEHM